MVVTSNTGPILVFTRIQPFGLDDFSFLGKVYSRHVTGSANYKHSSVCCPTSTVVRSLASVQNLFARFCCDNLFNSFLVPLQQIFFLHRIIGQRCVCVCVFITLVDTNNGSDCPAKTDFPVLTWQFLHSSHKFETAL